MYYLLLLLFCPYLYLLVLTCTYFAPASLFTIGVAHSSYCGTYDSENNFKYYWHI